MIEIEKTQTVNGKITVKQVVDGKERVVVVKTMSQYIDEKGHRSGGIGESVMNKELYYANLEQMRADEDAFIQKIREIEDNFINNETDTLVN